MPSYFCNLGSVNAARKALRMHVLSNLVAEVVIKETSKWPLAGSNAYVWCFGVAIG